MKNRTSTLVICGLIIVILVLMFNYLTCQSKATEIQHTSNAFEDQIRVLNIKNTGYEQTIEAIITNTRTLEGEKTNMKAQMKNKSLEVNDLNEKLERNFEELQTLRSEKKTLEEQLRKFKELSEKILAKKSVIRKSHKDLDEQKKSNDQQLDVFIKQLNSLKEQVETYKQHLGQSQEKITTLPSITSSTTMTTTTQTSTLSTTRYTSTEPSTNPGVNNKLLDDLEDGSESLLKALHDVLYNNENDLSVGKTQMITTRTTTLSVKKRNLVKDEHMHVKDDQLEMEAN